MPMNRHDIAGRVRANAEEYQRQSKIFDPCLREMCAICTSALASAFLQAGYHARAFYGKFIRGGVITVGNGGSAHCWVEVYVGNYECVVQELWDITATQFDAALPAVFMTSVEDSRYQAAGELPELTDEHFWSKWPAHQRPSPDVVAWLLKGINGGAQPVGRAKEKATEKAES